MDASFRDRLARLRRETPARADASAADASSEGSSSEPCAAPESASESDAPRATPDAELPSWWKARVARGAPAAQLPPALDVGPPADLREASSARGAFAVRELRVALEQPHGAEPLARVLDVRSELFALLTGDARLAALDPRRALFLDIETTGLSGGAGTKAFLVGLGWIEAGEFVLWQGFLRGPEEEAALLEEVAQRVAGAQALVTFFGKTFDRHRLEDKMRVHGVRPPFEGRAHLDLYHPLRALYRPALDDARLGTLERVLCSVAREDDLSGAHAPAAWYDFLAGRPHRLERVFAHNRDDVLSLAALCAHLGSLEFAPRAVAATQQPSRSLEWARLRGLARALARHKRWSECATLASAARELALDEHARELDELIAKATRRARRQHA